MFERQVTLLRRYREICNPHNRQGCLRCNFFCALHPGYFSSKQKCTFDHEVEVRRSVKIKHPIWFAFLAFFFVAPLGTYSNMLPEKRLE